MLPLPEHLARSLQELHQYYQQLQVDYAEKLEALKQQMGHLEALQSGAVPHPPDLAEHLRELERYYGGLSSDIAQSGILAATQCDRVSEIIAHSRIEPNRDVVEEPATIPPVSRFVQEKSANYESLEQVVEDELPQALSAGEQVVDEVVGQVTDSSGYASGNSYQPTPDAIHLNPSTEQVGKQSQQFGEDSLPMPSALLNKFLLYLHPMTRTALIACRAQGKLYIENRDGVATVVIAPNDRNLEQRIKARLQAYQERFTTFLGEAASVVLVESVPSIYLLPEYEGLTLEQAIALLLGDNRGVILQRDYIVRALYGEVPQSKKATTYRQVSQALKAGVRSGLWDVDPDNADCYTLNYYELLHSVST